MPEELSSTSKDFGQTTNSFKSKINFNMPNFNMPSYNPRNVKGKIKRNHLIIVGAILALVLTFLAGRQFAPHATLGNTNADQRTEAPTPIASQTLNKGFEFPLTDAKGKEVAKIKYLLESANLQDSFIYQGKLATAVKGRQFLIFNVKITNPYKDTIEVNTKDYIRVKMNGSEEQLAPEIHNDPVQVQGNSTKYARIGLPINETDKDIILLIGELEGQKETVKLNLAR
jgi:hypothetical protein